MDLGGMSPSFPVFYDVDFHEPNQYNYYDGNAKKLSCFCNAMHRTIFTCPTFTRWSVELVACNLHVPSPDMEINSLFEGIRKWYEKNVSKFRILNMKKGRNDTILFLRPKPKK